MNTKTGKDVVGKDWNVRTGVHEYGGAPAIVHNGTLYFSHIKDGRIYRAKEGEEPEAVTPGEMAFHCISRCANIGGMIRERRPSFRKL